MKKIIYSPAKINLYLNVLNKRKDGFHNIESVFSEVSLYDEITISSSNVFKFELDKNSSDFAFKFKLEQNNLLKDIFFYFKEKYDIQNLSIQLLKRIPIGAGLGGGSSNAAYFMNYLNSEFQLNLNNNELKKIAMQFGSDIPFFIDGKSAIIKNKGEIVEKINIQAVKNCLIVFPDVYVSTKKAYEKLGNFKKNNNFKAMCEWLIKKKEANNLKKNQFLFYNSFEENIRKSFTVINEIYSKVEEEGGFSLLSGSGSSIIVFFDDENMGNRIKKKMGNFTSYIYDVKLLSE